MKQAADVERHAILEATRAKSASEREQKAAAKREKSTAKAEAEAQKKQVDDHRAEIELQVKNDKAIQEATSQEATKKNKKPPSASPKPKVKAKKTESLGPEHRSFSRATNFVSEPGSRSRSRTKGGIVLPTKEEGDTGATAAVRKGRGPGKKTLEKLANGVSQERGRQMSKPAPEDRPKRETGKPRNKSAFAI